MSDRATITIEYDRVKGRLCFSGHISYWEIESLELQPIERRILDDCGARDATPNYWMHALAMLFDKLQQKEDERARRAAAQTNDNTD
ncbi:hypothetical protein [Burkholderia cenocepacia]|uniref:hypothetical protein n=1 Tax=Burkholderia cenocepacia TaxID=95486 RepID=UPI0026507029|nr:hypothetical protein [Burkholderia cenocepacia]MDN7456582.1 hypothetical protein [Burkholderia cenocepacia]